MRYNRFRHSAEENCTPASPAFAPVLLRGNRMAKILAGFFLALAPLLAPSAAAAEFRAGIAVRKVTPDPLLPVTGGVGGANPVTRKIGELTVRALALENGGNKVVVVGADFLGFPSVLCARVRALVKTVPAQNILIGSTHTHSAPDMYGFPGKDGKTSADFKYIDWVCKQMAEAIEEAVARLEPAVLKSGVDEAKGKISYNYYAPALYDPRMNVLQFVSAQKAGQTIATLVNYASHPEVIGPDQGILSPDFCGPLYDRIAEKGGGTALFMNSAQGGMVTADIRDPGRPGKDIQTWDECVRIGQLMADEALRIASAVPTQPNPGLACFATTVNLPVESPLMKKILAMSPLGFKTTPESSVPAQVNVINLGTAQILTIPGEALPNIGYYLKRKMRGEQNLLFGLTNDALGYMLSKYDFNSFRRYEYISRTSLGENTAEIYIDQALKFLYACPAISK